ncbi:MAG: DUF4097 family beta strand repeat protein [bacterium]|nr:DUF4097 family beta strand repeat protein [bacterium]
MKLQRKILVSLAVLILCGTLPLAAAELVEESVETYPLSAGGRVSLENINGDVTIEAWDRDDVSVETVKRGRTQEDLDAVEIKIDAQADRIHIETDYENRDRGRKGRHNHASVDFKLLVPRGAELDEIELVNGDLDLDGIEGDVNVSLVNGDLNARGLTGNVELSSVNGEVDVALASLDPDRSVSLESVNGSVELAVPAGADAEFEAETVHGSIRSDFGFEVKRGDYVGSSLRGTLGSGGARVELETVNGSIEIRQN